MSSPISQFKSNPASAIGNSFVVLYTAPALKTSFGIELDVACTSNTGVQVDVILRRSGTAYYVVKGAPIPVGSSLQVIDGQKMVLQPGDSVEVQCTTAGQTVDAIFSYVEDVNS